MSYKLNNYKSKGMNTQVMDKLKIHLPQRLFGTQNWPVWSATVSYPWQSSNIIVYRLSLRTPKQLFAKLLRTVWVIDPKWVNQIWTISWCEQNRKNTKWFSIIFKNRYSCKPITPVKNWLNTTTQEL